MINLSNVNGLMGIEMEQFFHHPVSSSGYPDLLGIAIEGCRGRYNQFGNQTEVIKTIPFSNGEYNFSVQEPDVNRFQNSPTTFNVAFIDRTVTNSLNPGLTKFNSNYLLVLNIYTV